MTITIIQMLIFLLYVGFITYKFGVLPSISDSWYELKPLKLGFLFTLFCWSIGFLLVTYSGYTNTPFFFLSGAGLCFVGVATAFKIKKSTERRIHVIGANVCVLSALVGLWVDFHLWYFLPLFLLCYLILKLLKIKNIIWWVEITAFVLILIGLLIK